MTGQIKFVFALDEVKARASLIKGQQEQQLNSTRSNIPSALHDSAYMSEMASDFGANPVNSSQNMMGFMFEAFLQNQIEAVV